MESFLGFYLILLLFGLLDVLGFILAIVFYRRCPMACNLVIGSTLLHLLGIVGRIGFNMWRLDGDMGNVTFGWAMSGISVLNWISYALLLAAVFSGRNEPTQSPSRARRRDRHDEDPEWESPPDSRTPPKTSDHTGIEERK